MINRAHIDNLKHLSIEYSKNIPYPHIVLDDFLANDKAEILLKSHEEYFNNSESEKIDYSTLDAIKYASVGYPKVNEDSEEILEFFLGNEITSFLSTLTGIKEPLISDREFFGGGFHFINKGGYLNVHVDFNKHPKNKLDRRINIILFLNKEWKEEWNGDLQLWSTDGSEKVKGVFPRFNRAVIFSTTDFSWHGHPQELNTPTNVNRRTVALYYFSDGRPNIEINQDVIGKSTTWKRPENRKGSFQIRAKEWLASIMRR